MTQADLMKYLKYNPETGLFTWAKLRKGASNIKIGDIAGSVNSSGYVLIGIGKATKTLMAHRLAFLYMTGDIPSQVDHINHKKTDNRWINLRPATQAINAMNHPMRLTNTSGCTGVAWNKKHHFWVVQIGHKNKKIYLGCYKNKETAFAIRKGAECWYGYHINHGKQEGMSNEQN